jgi:hypothetical protein
VTWLISLAASTDFGDISSFVNFGVLGLVVLSLITGWLWTKPSVDRLEKERDRAIAEREKAEAQRDAMAQVLQERLLPVVGDFITTTRSLLPILQQLQQLQQMIPILQQFLQQGGEHRHESPPPPSQGGRRRRSDP